MSATHVNPEVQGNGRELLFNNYGTPPRIFARGQRSELWDKNGKRHLDFLCGLAVTSLGHAHPKVSEAVANQAKKLTHTSNLYGNEHQVPVAAIINNLIGAQNGRVLFQNSGAEANEAAIKLVRKFQGRGRHIVVCAFRSFHGRTMATLAATGQTDKHEPFHPLPEEFRHVVFDDIADLERVLTPEVGAIMLESVQGEGGVHPASDEYLLAVRQICDERQILLMMDEIQTGFGRTGAWFGYQHSGIEADVVTMAKALGNGMPVGAMWAREEVAVSFKPGDHGSTFAGQPLALAAARATLETYVEMDAPAVVRSKEATLRAALSKVEGIEDIRGRGLLLAAELSEAALAGRTAKEIATACLDEGLIVNGITATALRLAPAYIVTDEEIAEAAEIIGRVLGSTQ